MGSSERPESRIGAAVRRVLAGGLALSAGVLVVWSFGWVATRPLRQDDDDANKIEISILHWGDRREDQIVEELIASCEAAHPNIKIKRMKVAWSGFDAKLQTMIAGGNPPDLFFYNSHMLPNFGGKDAIRPIDDFVEEDRKNGTLPFEFDDLYAAGVLLGRGRPGHQHVDRRRRGGQVDHRPGHRGYQHHTHQDSDLHNPVSQPPETTDEPLHNGVYDSVASRTAGGPLARWRKGLPCSVDCRCDCGQDIGRGRTRRERACDEGCGD